MNGSASLKTEYAAWRGLFTQPDTEKLGAAAVIYTASALILPLCVDQTLAMLFIAACALFYYLQVRTLTAMLLPAVPALILFSVSGSVLLPAAFFGIVFGGACGAMLLTSVQKKKTYALLTLLPIAAYLIAFFIKGDAINAALTLIPLPIAVITTLALNRAKPFIEAHIWITGTVMLTLLAAGTLTLLVTDQLSPDLLDRLVGTMNAELLARAAEASALYEEAGLAFSISETELKNTVAMLVNLSPALFAVISMIVAFFTNMTLHRLLLGFGVLPRIPQRLTVPIISPHAAILFFLACLVSLFAGSSEATIVGVTASNLMLILEPCLAYLGALLLFHKRESRSCLSLVLMLVMIMVLWSDPSLCVVLLALYGAVNVLLARFARPRAK